MLKALLIWVLVIAIIACAVALMGPLFVGMVALDTSPEGVGILLSVMQ